MDDTDKDALTWAGDEARMRGSGTWSVPQRDGGASSSSSSSNDNQSTGSTGKEGADGSAVDSKNGVEAEASSPEHTAEAKSESTTWRESVALLVTGVFAGLFLLITAAWLITALRNPITIADPIASLMFSVTLWLAVAAGPLIFITVLSLRRGVMVRFVLLFLGAVALIPWPYLTWVG